MLLRYSMWGYEGDIPSVLNTDTISDNTGNYSTIFLYLTFSSLTEFFQIIAPKRKGNKVSYTIGTHPVTKEERRRKDRGFRL
jgi:hypothetical protein